MNKKYKIEFHKDALKEFKKLDNSIKEHFKKAIKKIIQNPRIPSKELHGNLNGFYKIKDSKSGFRIVYNVIEEIITIKIWAVGKRDKKEVYKTAGERIDKSIKENA